MYSKKFHILHPFWPHRPAVIIPWPVFHYVPVSIVTPSIGRLTSLYKLESAAGVQELTFDLHPPEYKPVVGGVGQKNGTFDHVTIDRSDPTDVTRKSLVLSFCLIFVEYFDFSTKI